MALSNSRLPQFTAPFPTSLPTLLRYTHKTGDYLTFSRKQYNPTHVEKNPPNDTNPARPGSFGSTRYRNVLYSPIHVKLAWRINDLRTNIIYFFHRPRTSHSSPPGNRNPHLPTRPALRLAPPLPRSHSHAAAHGIGNRHTYRYIHARPRFRHTGNIPFVNQTGRIITAGRPI